MSLRVDPKRLASAALLAGGLLLVVLGFLSASPADDAAGRPPAIERVIPGENSLVLRQSELGADLAPGYTGELLIDGRLLPTQEVVAAEGVGPTPVPPVLVTRYDPAQNTLLFQPRAGAPIERLDPGPHDVTVRFWKPADGPDEADEYTFTITVS